MVKQNKTNLSSSQKKNKIVRKGKVNIKKLIESNFSTYDTLILEKMEVKGYNVKLIKKIWVDKIYNDTNGDLETIKYIIKQDKVMELSNPPLNEELVEKMIVDIVKQYNLNKIMKGGVK